MPVFARVLKIRAVGTPERFVIRDVHHRGSTAGNAVRDRWRRVVQILRFDQDFTNPKEPFLQFREMNSAGEVMQLYREVGVLHLSGQRVFKTSLKPGRSVDVQFCARKKSRSEERETLNVIPMSVADQQVNPVGSGTRFQKIESEFADTGSAIKNN